MAQADIALPPRRRTSPWPPLAVGVAVLGGLLASERVSYLLFHTLTELFSVVVAVSVFALAWSARHTLANGYLLVVGVAYLAVGFLDSLHTLAYQGMPVLPHHPFAANQLWIAARGLEAGTLVVAFAFLRLERLPSPARLLAAYAVITAALVASIFWWDVFPACYVEGVGQTTFKIAAEYVIIATLAVAAVLLHLARHRFDPKVHRLLLGALVTAVASEFAFTLYVSNYGPANLVGHLLKVASFLLVYLAIVETGLRRPYGLVFRELSEANARLRDEVAARTEAERQQARLIGELRAAMEEVRTLRGIIPICSHCRKIRDDAGSWDQMEAYLSRHSEARFSHGICPDCLARHYPGA